MQPAYKLCRCCRCGAGDKRAFKSVWGMVMMQIQHRDAAWASLNSLDISSTSNSDSSMLILFHTTTFKRCEEAFRPAVTHFIALDLAWIFLHSVQTSKLHWRIEMCKHVLTCENCTSGVDVDVTLPHIWSDLLLVIQYDVIQIFGFICPDFYISISEISSSTPW